MNIQLIRHATVKVKYNNLTILVDPMFSPKESLDPCQRIEQSFASQKMKGNCSNTAFPMSSRCSLNGNGVESSFQKPGAVMVPVS